MTVPFKFIEIADTQPLQQVKLVNLARGGVQFSTVQD